MNESLTDASFRLSDDVIGAEAVDLNTYCMHKIVARAQEVQEG